MDVWHAPDSILAPIVAGVPPTTTWAGFKSALLMVTRRIPPVSRQMRVKKTGFSPARPETWTRSVGHLSEPQPFTAAVWLVEDRPDGQPVDIYWQLSLTHLKDGLCSPAIPADFDSAILQVSMFQLVSDGFEHTPHREGLQGAPQLALARYLWTAEVKAASAEAIVFGGQHHWEDAWWNESPTPREP